MVPDRGTGRRVAYVSLVLVLALGMLFPSGVLGAVGAAQTTTRPSVTTEPATNVTTDAATLNGNLTDLGGAGNATVWFEYWKQGNRSGTAAFAGIQVREANGTFAADVSGLDRNTTYVYVARAETDAGTVSGDRVTFTTDANVTVDVDTRDVRNVSDSSARLVGDLETLDGARNATVRFEYWRQGARNATLTRTDNLTVGSQGGFATTVFGLANDTTYVVRARATAKNVSDAGGTVRFTTAGDDPPAVDTDAATNVTTDAATLAGDLTDLGGAGNATVRFEYWKQGDRNGTAAFTPSRVLEGPGTFDAAVSGLAENTTYVYVAHVEAADNDTATGEPVTLTTDDAEQEEEEEEEEADDGDQRGPGDESGEGDEYGPGNESGEGDERGPGDESGEGDEYGPGEERGPGQGHGPEQAGPPDHAKAHVTRPAWS